MKFAVNADLLRHREAAFSVRVLVGDHVRALAGHAGPALNALQKGAAIYGDPIALAV
jgi:hypothetical protein